MQDKYFFTTEEKNTLTAAIGITASSGALADNVISGIDGNYFETPDLILLWVGKIPKDYDEDGNITDYEAAGAEHFNIRSKTGAFPDFGEMAVTEVTPATPYSVFA